MTGQVRRSIIACGLFATLLPGCLTCLNPVAKPASEFREACEQIPTCSRSRVYVVLINGVDPLCCANLQGVREYLNELGFVKSFYAQIYHDQCLLDELRAIREEQPEARFAIVGFDHGAVTARKLADKAANEGLGIDLLVLMQPKCLIPTHTVASAAIGKTIVFQSGTCDWKGLGIDEGDVVQVPCSNRFGVPTHPITLSMLTEELTSLAENVPVEATVSEAFPPMSDDPAPSPRPIANRPASGVDQWDFLKPVSRRKDISDPASKNTAPLMP